MPDPETPPLVPKVCLERLGLKVLLFLGGRVNQHWLVDAGGVELVLRAYPVGQLDNVGYEHEVLRRLHQLGWPVPQLVGDQIREDNQSWCLFTFLAGTSLTSGPQERRARGRLLARLHESTASFADLGQRSGFCTADEYVARPTLLQAMREYERLRPEAGHMMRWHLDKAIELFGRAQPGPGDLVVLHSDFATWNVLFHEGKLSGIIDFEFTHLNYRVSDFALAWRGNQDEVIHGYEEIRPLSGREREMLVPAYWSWLFLGFEAEVQRMISGSAPVHDFDWQLQHLRRRSSFHADIPVYPG